MSSVWGAAANRALRNRLSRVGVTVLAILLVLIAFGPLVWTVSPTDQDLTARLSGMSAQHPYPRARRPEPHHQRRPRLCLSGGAGSAGVGAGGRRHRDRERLCPRRRR